jgi:hypothetical protein
MKEDWNTGSLESLKLGILDAKKFGFGILENFDGTSFGSFLFVCICEIICVHLWIKNE